MKNAKIYKQGDNLRVLINPTLKKDVVAKLEKDDSLPSKTISALVRKLLFEYVSSSK